MTSSTTNAPGIIFYANNEPVNALYFSSDDNPTKVEQIVGLAEQYGSRFVDWATGDSAIMVDKEHWDKFEHLIELTPVA